jgi:hypothetical protein
MMARMTRAKRNATMTPEELYAWIRARRAKRAAKRPVLLGPARQGVRGWLVAQRLHNQEAQ